MPTNFLDAAGASGFITAPFALETTELNTLGAGSVALSSVNGVSGKFNQSNTGSASFASMFFISGGSFTPSGNARIDGWFILSPDGGSTFEKASAVPPRAPDFSFPLATAAYAANDMVWCQGRFVVSPWESFKVLIQNNSGVTLPASGNIVKLGGTAIQY